LLQNELSIARPLYVALVKGGNLYARNAGLNGVLRIRLTNEQAATCALILVNDKANFINHLN